jgi:hypothetical protein
MKGIVTPPRGTAVPTDGAIEIGKRTQATRPQGRGGGKNRGDRRDTNQQFTGNNRRQPNFSDPLGSGKKQIQGGGKARRGGGKKQKGTYDSA